LNSKLQSLFIVAHITLSHGVLETGILSQVIIDSSTEDIPLIISQSTGILVHGFTIIISHICKSETGISSSIQSFIIRAVFAHISISFFIASEVLPFVRASKYFHSKIKAIITQAVSKYKCFTKEISHVKII
jgi:hypothetical protein